MSVADLRSAVEDATVRPDPAAPAAVRRPARRPHHGSRAERLAVGAGMLLIAVVYALNVAGWPRYFDDEGTYYSQAWAAQHLGSLSPYTYWYDHPPVGWLQLSAFTWLPDLLVDGNSAVLSGRIVMVGYTVATAGLLYMLARRLHMTRTWSGVAMLVWALDPLALYEGRQVFLDTVALPWLVGAFVLALNHRRHLGLHMAAGSCFAIAVLSKETTIVFAVPLLLAIWQTAYRPTRRFALMGFTAVTAMTGAMYLLFALIRDELFPGPGHVSLWDALAFQFLDREGSGSLLDASGPDGGAYTTFHSWLQHDPYLLLGGVGAGVALLAVRRLRPVGVAVVLAALVALRPGGYLPQMYVVAVLPFCALAVVGLADAVWQGVRRLRHRAVLSGALLVGLGVVATAVAGSAAGTAAHWRAEYRAAWTEDTNDPQSAILGQVEKLPADAVIAVDNTYWNDLVDQGRDQDDVVWFFKVDSDAAVSERLGATYLGMDYLVWTRYVADNAGPVVRAAYAHSTLVTRAGTEGAAVELRRVLQPAEEAAIMEAEAEELAARLASERAALQQRLDQPSRQYAGLTNGQVDAIRQEAAAATVAQLARKYQTDRATVRAVLAGKG